MIPKDILLARALSHLDRAMLELREGNVSEGGEWVARGIDLLREALQ